MGTSCNPAFKALLCIVWHCIVCLHVAVVNVSTGKRFRGMMNIMNTDISQFSRSLF